MSGDASIPPPAVLWAQRNHVVFLTICIEDCKAPILEINPQNIYFRGTGGPDRKEHEVNIELYADIIPAQSKHVQTGRTIEIILQKKELGQYWPHLTRTKQRYHWLKVNFAKWQDENDSENEVENEDNFDEMMRSMGDLGTGDRPSFDDTDSDDADKEQDEEDLPPLE